MRFWSPRPGIIAALVVAAIGPAHGENAIEPFFRGKVITIHVGSSAGGGYDTYARLVARHLGKHIPGRPIIVVRNMPGSSSNKAASYLFSEAPNDGTAIGALFPSAILQPLLGRVAVQHAPDKFIYLGSSSSDVLHCFVRADAPAKTFREAQQREVILGAGNDGTTRELPAMLNNLAGAKFRTVTGFASSQEIVFAVERNKVHGACGIGWAGFGALYPYWFDKKLVTMILQLAVKGHPELDAMGVPLATAFARSPEDRQAMDLVLSQGLFGRPYVLPPGVPPDRVALLRKAFMDAMTDPALVADARRTNLEIGAMSGADLQALVASLYAMPSHIVDRAKQSLAQKPKR
jgi:tripartite-type tricarboxylate transporter receptor subunit TctC